MERTERSRFGSATILESKAWNRMPRGLALVAFATVLASPAFGQAEIDSLLDEGAAVERPEAAPGEERPSTPTAPAPRRIFEEILVTAQKTEERLHDVPISMTVLDEEFLNQESFTDLNELSQYVPNVKIFPTAFTPRANIRGFELGRDANKGSEPPMGLTIDGIPYPNPNYLQTGFFDVGRIEVLRGPQNTLFGKSNSVGLFNMTTKNPTDEYSGFLDAELGDFDRRRFEGAIGGPLLPGILNFRIAALSDDRDGFLRNTTADVVPGLFRSPVGLDRKAVRVKAQLPDLLGADLVVSYERYEVRAFGIEYELAIVPEGTKPLFREFDPNADFEGKNHIISIDYPSVVRVDVDTLVASGRYDLGGWGLDAIVGHSEVRVDNDLDADLSPAPVITAFTRDKNPQTTVELRTTSPNLPGFFGLERLFGLGLGSTDFTAGIFYQRRRITDSAFTISLDTGLVAAFAFLGGNPPPAGAPLPPMPFTRDAAGQNVEDTTMFYEQTSDSVAGFSHVSWSFAERWTLIGGLRMGYETKEADFERVFSGDPPGFLTAGGFQEFTAHRTLSEFQATPRVNLRYDVTDEINTFATWAKGFRGGGFNATANRLGNLEFDPESVTNWEVGTNLLLLGGAARVNLALFRMTLTDFQVLTTEPGTTTSIITNAGEARAQGVEADGSWLPLDWLTLRGTFGFNDAEFVEFPFGPCIGDRENTDGDDDERCDLSGKSMHQVPQWVVTLTPSVSFPLREIPVLGSTPLPASGISLIGSLTGQYHDTMLLDVTLDPRLRASSFFEFDGAVGFENVDQGWSLRVSVKNLADDASFHKGIQAPLLPGHIIKVTREPRHVIGELRWSF